MVVGTELLNDRWQYVPIGNKMRKDTAVDSIKKKSSQATRFGASTNRW